MVLGAGRHAVERGGGPLRGLAPVGPPSRQLGASLHGPLNAFRRLSWALRLPLLPVYPCIGVSKDAPGDSHSALEKKSWPRYV